MQGHGQLIRWLFPISFIALLCGVGYFLTWLGWGHAVVMSAVTVLFVAVVGWAIVTFPKRGR